MVYQSSQRPSTTTQDQSSTLNNSAEVITCSTANHRPVSAIHALQGGPSTTTQAQSLSSNNSAEAITCNTANRRPMPANHALHQGHIQHPHCIAHIASPSSISKCV